MTTIIAQLNQVGKTYCMGDQTIVALQSTTLQLRTGELVLIMGPSGSGKTTLLSLLGCVIYPSSGDLWIDGQRVNTLTNEAMARLRLNTIGFVFQHINLLAPLTAEANVRMPLQLQGINRQQARTRSQTALQQVGIADRSQSMPNQLSGGQQQRVAIARALVTNPKLVLCDEPTAALDKDSIRVVMSELRALADNGKAVAVVTHDPRLKPYAHRIMAVNNGMVKEMMGSTDAE